MHFQNTTFWSSETSYRSPAAQSVDFVIDVRKNSPTFKEYASIELSRKIMEKMIYIPEGFAHGFLTLEENTCVFYKLSNYYSPEHEITLKWNDPTIGIEWGAQSDASAHV